LDPGRKQRGNSSVTLRIFQVKERRFEDVSEALTETMVSSREGEIFKVNNTRQLTQESSGRKEDQGSEVQLII
jgi:hypothetical protein